MYEIEYIEKDALRSEHTDDLRWTRIANVWSRERDRDDALEWLSLDDDGMVYRACACQACQRSEP